MLLQIVLMIYKLMALWYPKGQFGIEICIIIGYAILAYSRLKIGQQGNARETIFDTTLFLVLSVFATLGNLYFIFLQTYM